MKVGVTIPAYELGSGRGRTFEAMAEDLVAAEQLGYDSAWVMDHFFVERGSRRVLGGPYPLAFLSHAAPQTTPVALSTTVPCAPFQPAAALRTGWPNLQSTPS